MLNGITRLGVDCVGVFLAVLIVEVAVVATCCHSHILDVEHSLQLFVHSERVVAGLCHSSLPGQAFLADAFSHNLTANLYKVVVDAMPAQEGCHNVASITFGYCATVEHHSRVGLAYVIVFKRNLLVAYHRAQGVDSGLAWRVASLEAESYWRK